MLSEKISYKIVTTREVIMDLETWDINKKRKEVSVSQIRELMEHYAATRADYEAKKAESNKAYDEVKKLQMDIVNILNDANLKSFKVDGLGTVTKKVKTSVTTPKTIEDKKAMFAHFKEQGEDTFWTYATVNSQSLNSYYRNMSQEAAERGETFNIPGVGEPTMMEEISFRKGK